MQWQFCCLMSKLDFQNTFLSSLEFVKCFIPHVGIFHYLVKIKTDDESMVFQLVKLPRKYSACILMFLQNPLHCCQDLGYNRSNFFIWRLVYSFNNDQWNLLLEVLKLNGDPWSLQIILTLFFPSGILSLI